MAVLTSARKLLASVVLALLGPLPFPHADTYIPAVVGLTAAVQGARENGPTLLLLMLCILLAYGAAAYCGVSLAAAAVGRTRGR